MAGVVLFPLSLGGVFGSWSNGVPRNVIGILLALLQSVPLFWRRRHPLMVLLVVVAAVSAMLALGFQVAASVLAVGIAVYSVSAYGDSRPRLAVAGASAVAVVAGVAGRLLAGRNDILPFLLPIAAVALVAWVLGDYFRNRRLYLADLERRARVAAEEVEEARRQAADQERLRIARELHDVVAHNVSVMAIQAGGARLTGGTGRDAGKALESIEVVARDTLTELNRLLGVLRKDGEAGALSPQPGLEQVDALLKPVRDSGLQVDLEVTGERRPLPAALDVSAYRIVQEAVTNVLKHSAASRLEVRVSYGVQAVELIVADNGRGSPESSLDASTGHGLIGMRERVELYGGELKVGSGRLGGFTVTARLPLDRG